MKNSLVCMGFALSLALVSSGTAQANYEQDRRVAFETARQAMQDKDWAEAHRIFAELFRGQRTYDVALHLGQAEYHLRRFRDAAEHLAFGLALLPPRERPEISDRSRAILELCKQEIATLELRVMNKQAKVLVDGVTVAEAPLVTDTYVNPGTHQFEVRLAGYKSERWTLQLEKGDVQQRIVLLKADNKTSQEVAPDGPKPALGLSVATTPFDDRHRVSKGSWTPVVAGGLVSVVGFGAAIGFAVVRSGLTSDAREILSDLHKEHGQGACINSLNDADVSAQCSRLQKKNSDYDSYGSLEAVGFTLGGVALIASTTYFLFARPDQTKLLSPSAKPPLHVNGSLGKGSASLQVSADF